MNPLMSAMELCADMSTTSSASPLPSRLVILYFRDFSFLSTKISLPLWVSVKAVSGRVTATLVNSSTMCLNSTLSLLRNFLLAGVLKNRLRTEKLEPTGTATLEVFVSAGPPVLTCIPVSSHSLRVRRVTSDTAAMLARASPRKP